MAKDLTSMDFTVKMECLKLILHDFFRRIEKVGKWFFCQVYYKNTLFDAY